jgi:hypothetical protein
MNEIVPSLAYLFYAVMRSDKKIDSAEWIQLHEMLDAGWEDLAQKGDPFGAMGMELIENMIKDLD